MRRPVADDILAVLEEIRFRFQSVGSVSNVHELRKKAVEEVAQTEVEVRRFANKASAENSIHDACVRRLGLLEVAEFDSLVNNWLHGHPGPLSTTVVAKTTTDSQRMRLAELLAITDSQLVTPIVQDLEMTPADRVGIMVSRIVRDTRLSNRVKALHNYECQICGFTLLLADGSRYAEGHHIQPLGGKHNGPDVLHNIICLCPNHHAACDLGAIELVQSKLRVVDGHSVDQRFMGYHNSSIYRGKNH